MAKHAPPRHRTTRPFDDTTKESYRHLFENWGLSVETFDYLATNLGDTTYGSRSSRS
jgi:hypothetical protein